MTCTESTREVPARSYHRLLSLVSALVLSSTACADAPDSIYGPASIAEHHRALSTDDEESLELTPSDEELILEEERLAYESAVARWPEIAERVAAASTEIAAPDKAYALTPTEHPVDDSFCTTDRLPHDKLEFPHRDQRVIASSRHHRNDVDHLVRARTRKASDTVSPETLRDLVGTDGSWRPEP